MHVCNSTLQFLCVLICEVVCLLYKAYVDDISVRLMMVMSC